MVAAEERSIRRAARRRARAAGGGRRRGLAPLELVMWLPVLLMTAALFVNYGTMAAWRIRGEVAARDAAWRRCWPRSQGVRRPPNWPPPAGVSAGGGPAMDVLDLPGLDVPAIRGPLPNGFRVRSTLDPKQGALTGHASISRPFPLLPRMGRYQSGDIRHPLLDQKMRAGELGDMRRLRRWAYTSRRTLALYELPQTDQSLYEAFVDAIVGLIHIPHFDALVVLDRDEDWRRYGDWPRRRGSPDFHPSVGRPCMLDAQQVYEQRVKRLLDRLDARGDVQLGLISTLPRRMAQSFLNMYRRAVGRMEAEIARLQALLQGPPPPSLAERMRIEAQIQAIQAEIASIEPKIQQLEEYLNNVLPPLEEQLKQQVKLLLGGGAGAGS